MPEHKDRPGDERKPRPHGSGSGGRGPREGAFGGPRPAGKGGFGKGGFGKGPGGPRPAGRGGFGQGPGDSFGPGVRPPRGASFGGGVPFGSGGDREAGRDTRDEGRSQGRSAPFGRGQGRGGGPAHFEGGGFGAGARGRSDQGAGGPRGGAGGFSRGEAGGGRPGAGGPRGDDAVSGPFGGEYRRPFRADAGGGRPQVPYGPRGGRGADFHGGASGGLRRQGSGSARPGAGRPRPDFPAGGEPDGAPRPARTGFGFTDDQDWTGPRRVPRSPDAERQAPPMPAERDAEMGRGPSSRPAPSGADRGPRPIVRRPPAVGRERAPWRPPAVAPAPPRPDLVGEDEELVAGRHPVEEAFIARREAHRLLVVPQRRQALEKLVLHATNLRIPIVEVEGGTLTQLAGFDGHQGIALVTDHRRYQDLDAILARAIERGEPPFVLVLDSLEDPQNFGSLLRTAEASGVDGVIFPTHRQAPLSPAAVKSSAGAVEHLLLAPVDDLAEALADLHVRGLRIVGTDADAPLTARETDLRGPVAIVVGSEGQGLGPAVRRRCDALVRIPMRGHVDSLNASVAGSILLYEAASQRGGAAGFGVGRPAIEPGRATETSEAARVAAGQGARETGAAGEAEAAAGPGSGPDPAAEKPAAARPRRTRKPAGAAPVGSAAAPADGSPDAAAGPAGDAHEALLPGGPAASNPAAGESREP